MFSRCLGLCHGASGSWAIHSLTGHGGRRGSAVPAVSGPFIHSFTGLGGRHGHGARGAQDHVALRGATKVTVPCGVLAIRTPWAIRTPLFLSLSLSPPVCLSGSLIGFITVMLANQR